jgi:parvulin-like peptidyl-prolyl isomerase
MGALVGLVAAAVGLGLHAPRSAAFPDGAVATVNGAPVRSAEYERAVGALAADRRAPLGEGDRRFVLDRLVDEELLVQRALELGLVRSDRRARSDLVSALVDSVVADASQREPDAAELRAFYQDNRDWFAQPGRIRVRQIAVAGPPTRDDAMGLARAQEAARRLRAGEDFGEVERALGDPAVAPVPDDLLPAAKLGQYLGASALAATDALAPGAVSDPLHVAGGWSVLVLAEREPARTPALSDIGDSVRAELRRRAGDTALRRYIEELRRRAEIRVAGTLP